MAKHEYKPFPEESLEARLESLTDRIDLDLTEETFDRQPLPRVIKGYPINGPRPLSVIAREIHQDWMPHIFFGAKPYLEAMATLDSINDNFMFDSGVSIVLYFLSNAKAWKGETARRVKAELKQMVKAAK
jgi:hypothetical protein